MTAIWFTFKWCQITQEDCHVSDTASLLMGGLLAQDQQFPSQPELCLPQTVHPLYQRMLVIVNKVSITIFKHAVIFIEMLHLLPLSVLKSANNRRSLLLLATSMLTMSGGLFWFAANSCKAYTYNWIYSTLKL